MVEESGVQEVEEIILTEDSSSYTSTTNFSEHELILYLSMQVVGSVPCNMGLKGFIYLNLHDALKGT